MVALVTHEAAVSHIVGLHALTAPAAGEQAGKQCGTAARNTQILRSVRRHLRTVPLVGFPEDIGRPAVPEQHLPSLAVCGADRWCGGTPSPVSVSPGICRVAQHPSELIPVGTAPLKFARGRPGAD